MTLFIIVAPRPLISSDNDANVFHYLLLYDNVLLQLSGELSIDTVSDYFYSVTCDTRL